MDGTLNTSDKFLGSYIKYLRHLTAEGVKECSSTNLAGTKLGVQILAVTNIILDLRAF